MIFFGIAVAAFLLGLIWLGVSASRAQARRERFLSAPFPKAWTKIIRQHVPAVAKIPPELRPRYAHHIKLFLLEKTFEACGGLERVPEKIAVIVAANAAFLSLGRDFTPWRALHAVLIYPSTFCLQEPLAELSADADSGAALPLDNLAQESDGESRGNGTVILSLERILRDAAYSGNVQNVILHEFAHQFADTEPHYFPAERLRAWECLFEREMERLRAEDSKTILDEYGADDPAEFFAVSTEAFFGTPEKLRHAHPEVYAALSEIYALDPAAWK